MTQRPHDGPVLGLQDSQVSRIVPVGADLHLFLSAAHVSGPVGWFKEAPGESVGYLAPLVLIFRQARWQSELTLAMGRLAEGELWMHGQRLRRLPLPCESTTPVRARLAFANGVVLEIEAEALACPLSGDERFTASLAC
jgi:hypothetical protein